MTGGIEEVGALATAALAAGAIEAGDKGHGSAPAADGSARAASCLNCGATLQGAYCQNCGQAAHVHRSLLHLVEELLHGLFHFDAKGWRTLPMLVARPGLLTRRYIDGQRVRYVSPLALFLFTIFLMFFAASLSGGPPVGLGASSEAHAELEADLRKAAADEASAERDLAAATQRGGDVAAKAEALAEAKSDLADAQMALRTVDDAASAIAGRIGEAAPAASGIDAAAASAPRAAATRELAGSLGSIVRSAEPRKSGVAIKLEKGFGNVRWIDRSVKHAFANPELTVYKLKNSAYKFAFLLVPISLPFVWLLFALRRGPTMYDHAVFVLYSLSFMSLLFVALVVLDALEVPAWVLVLAGLLVPPLHMALQLRGTYGLGLAGTLWRTAALVLVAGVVSVLFVLFVAYVALV
jgi:hypothetical protein